MLLLCSVRQYPSYITNHLMTGPLGNSEFCFPRILMFPLTSSWETLRFSGNKVHCSPRDQLLSVNCVYIFTSKGSELALLVLQVSRIHKAKTVSNDTSLCSTIFGFGSWISSQMTSLKFPLRTDHSHGNQASLVTTLIWRGPYSLMRNKILKHDTAALS